MNADQWDGMRDRRSEILAPARQASTTSSRITGDIHAFYAGIPSPTTIPSSTSSSSSPAGISSGTFRTQLLLQVAADPILSVTPGASDMLAGGDRRPVPRHRRQQAPRPRRLGPQRLHATVELDGKEMISTFHAIAEMDVDVDLAGAAPADLASKFFKRCASSVEAGKRDLYKEIDGEWKRWDYDHQVTSDAATSGRTNASRGPADAGPREAFAGARGGGSGRRPTGSARRRPA
jgi:alkaline phosphatase D